MMLNNFIELAYFLIIFISSLTIYYSTKKLYELSSHKGIKHFRNTFLFCAVGFLAIYLQHPSGQLLTLKIISFISYPLSIIFYYSMSMAGFSLAYSLVWKEFTTQREYLLHATAIIIAILDVLYFGYLMFITQLIVLLYAITMSYSKYQEARKQKKQSFLQFHFIALILAFLGYLVNFISPFILPFFPFFIYSVYAITASVFLIFLYGVLRILKWPRKESA